MAVSKKAVSKKLRRRATVLFVGLCVLGTIVHFGILMPLNRLVTTLHTAHTHGYQSQASSTRSTRIPSSVQFVARPINEYRYHFIIRSENKCLSASGDREPIQLLLLVKSAVKHFKRRQVIRHTWGWEERFPEVTIRRVFNLGMREDKELMQEVTHEQDLYSDIIQSDFVDVYYNNTIKTMMGMRWVVENCRNTQFVMFVDDDFYISVRNVLRFIIHPIGYPYNVSAVNMVNHNLPINNGTLIELLAGRVCVNVRPQRRKKSMFYVSRKEYRPNKYPPFVTGGIIVMSIHTLHRMYKTCLYTRHFRFDDVYLGLVAQRAGIKPLHNEQFYTGYAIVKHDFENLIALHHYGRAAESVSLWLRQFKLKNA